MSPDIPPADASGLGVELRVAAQTHVGLVRRVNEDAVLAKWPVFLVADGMGGHSAGDLASAAIVAQFGFLVGRSDVTLDEIRGVINRAHLAVVELARHSPKGAGSTLSGAVMILHHDEPSWVVFNVGDSRVYRFALDGLEQITKDHSLVQDRIDAGELTHGQSQGQKDRNVITRAIGADEHEPDFLILPVTHGERLLMCTDGLTTMVSDSAIEAGLALGGDSQRTIEALIRHALKNGGKDNVSGIVLEVVGGGRPMSSELGTTEIFPEGDLEDTHDLRAERGADPLADDTVEMPRGNRGKQ